jgi:Gram-negative porin
VWDIAKLVRLLAAAMPMALAAGPVSAGSPGNWSVAPAEFTLFGMIGDIGGQASGALYDSRQTAGESRSGATGYLLVTPQLETVLDNAWELGLRGAVLAYHDSLSGDVYGDDTLQKAYGFLQMPYGRVEIGQQDGAGTKLSFTGPYVDDDVALNDANVSFFRGPHRALIDIFPMRSEMFASANDAKISYYIPHLTDFQLGFSYTPAAAKGVLPFIDSGHRIADRPVNILEAAGNYAGYFGPAILRAYAAIAIAHNDAATAGHDDLRDFAFGGEVDYALRGARLVLGGSYRRANTYTFDVDQPFTHGATSVARASAVLFRGHWSAGLEYETGNAPAHQALPQIGENGYEASIGYIFNEQLQVTGGWQHLYLTRSVGAFYDGLSRIEANAFFLHTVFRV